MDRRTLGGFVVAMGFLAAWQASAAIVAGDVDSSGAVNALDVQLVINGALGLSVSVNTNIDYSASGTDAIDVQLVINAALSLSIDADGDGLCNTAETNLGSLPNNVESDGDGLEDGEEVVDLGTDPASGSKWLRTVSEGADARAYSIRPTSDGGFILAGLTTSYVETSPDVFTPNVDAFVVKTDPYGDVDWTQTYGGDGNDEAFTAVEAADGGFVAVGYTESYGAGGKDVFLFKVTADGERAWYRTFGGTFDDRGYGLVRLPGGGFALCGYTRSYGAGERDVYFVMTDADGLNPQTSTFGGPRTENGYALVQVSDGFVVVGSSDYGNYTIPDTGLDVYMVKADTSGSFVGSTLFDGGGDEAGLSIQQTSDDGFVIGGFSTDATGDSDAYILRTDSDANFSWHQFLGGDEDDLANSVLVTDTDEIIVAGYSTSDSDRDGYLAKTNASGTVLWERYFGEEESDNLYGVSFEETGGGLVAAGISQSYGSTDWKVLLLGTDDEGRIEWSVQ